MPFDLHEMSKPELEQLKKDVDKALKDYDARKKAEAKAAAEKIAREFGFTLEEVVAAGGTKGSKGAPKYQNPSDATQTWTGRGRKPNWVIEHLDAGGALEDLLLA